MGADCCAPKVPPPKASLGARILIGIVAVSSVIAGIIGFLEAFYPNSTGMVSVSDKTGLNTVLRGGAPHVVLCTGGKNGDQFSSMFEKIAVKLRVSGTITAVRMDCESRLANGKSVIRMYNFDNSWQPVWFYVGHGKRPEQLPPNLLGETKKAVAHLQEQAVAGDSVTTIRHTGDLFACAKERTGGCVVVYSARNREELDSNLGRNSMGSVSTGSPLDVFPAVKFSVLDASRLTIRPGPADSNGMIQKLLTNTIRSAKAAAAGASSGEGVAEGEGENKPDVVLHVKRIPSTAVGGASNSPFLITVISPSAESKGRISTDAIGEAVGRSEGAVSYLQSVYGSSEGSSGVDVDALLERDDILLDRHASVLLLEKNAMYLTEKKAKKKSARAKVQTKTSKSSKAKAAAPKADDEEEAEKADDDSKGKSADGDDAPMDADARRARRAKHRAAHSESSKKTQTEQVEAEVGATGEVKEQAAPELTAAEIAERERRRRQQMQNEESASAHFAQLREEEEEGDQNGGSDSQSGNEQDADEDILDLDSAGYDDDE